jgi:autotransporter-associated beta strand protein
MKRSPQRKAALRRTASTSARLQDRNRKKRRNFFLERLEDRSLMAVLLWKGGTDANLSTPANWVGSVAPQQDDSLVFPASANLNITNDFAAGTRFRAITISASGYNISGNSITLLEGVTYNSSGAAATVTVPLTLSAGASIISANTLATLNLGKIDLGVGNTLTSDGKGNINVADVISGSGGAGIIKQGDGVLTLAGANTFDGAVSINQGVLSVTNSAGLGAGTATAGGGTFVNPGAQLQVSNNVVLAVDV